MGKLSAMGIKAAMEPGRYGDGDGLFLFVRKSGSKSWLVRVQKEGKRRDIGLGSASKVSLAQARDKARETQSQIEAGIDPVAERRKKDTIPTFRQAAALVYAQNRKTWRNGKHQWQWMRTLEMFAFPHIGDVSVADVTGPQIRDTLAEIWLTKPETARRVRQRIGAVLDWAYAKGWRESEAPLRSITKGLPKQPTQDNHQAAIPYADVPAFMARLHEQLTWGRLALAAQVLTAVRPGEVRLAQWDEVDLEAGLWTIPPERMKAKRPHVVPLSPAALVVFQRAASMQTQGSDLVFEGQRRGKPLSDMAFIRIMRTMGLDATAHGFRSCFRDWASETTSFPGDVCEAALAHKVKDKTEGAYRRGDLLEKRRDLMAAWGSYCSGATGNVVRLAVA